MDERHIDDLPEAADPPPSRPSTSARRLLVRLSCAPRRRRPPRLQLPPAGVPGLAGLPHPVAQRLRPAGHHRSRARPGGLALGRLALPPHQPVGARRAPADAPRAPHAPRASRGAWRPAPSCCGCSPPLASAPAIALRGTYDAAPDRSIWPRSCSSAASPCAPSPTSSSSRPTGRCSPSRSPARRRPRRRRSASVPGCCSPGPSARASRCSA